MPRKTRAPCWHAENVVQKEGIFPVVEVRGCSIVPICLDRLYHRTPKRVFGPVDFGELTVTASYSSLALRSKQEQSTTDFTQAHFIKRCIVPRGKQLDLSRASPLAPRSSQHNVWEKCWQRTAVVPQSLGKEGGFSILFLCSTAREKCAGWQN